MRIILHADDLGISHQVNDAIFHLMDEEKITSTSIVANGPAFDDAARRVQRFPHCSVGVHLNITEFAPLHPSHALAPLLENGKFQKPGRGYVYERSQAFAIFREWTEQVKRVRQSGIAVSHVDSHHHLHTRFSLLSCLKQVCRAENIRRVRIRHTFTRVPGIARWRIDNLLYNWRLRQHFVCADEFGSFASFHPGRVPPHANVELMLHPGNPRYHGEMKALQQALDSDFRHRHQCISYRDLN
jgi:predicted glycoside hydrolase/deacetylase ChbG (UPF0249 family)